MGSMSQAGRGDSGEQCPGREGVMWPGQRGPGAGNNVLVSLDKVNEADVV